MKKLIANVVMIVGFSLVSVVVQAASTVTFYHHDALGSVIATSDQDGFMEVNEEYQPYGEKIYGTEDPGSGNEDWYTGKNYSEELDLTYFGARWYDAKQGRFLSIDPVGVVFSDTHTFNRYHYANNNPYKYVDLDGNYADLAIEAISISVGVHSLSSNISQGNYGAATVDVIGLGLDLAGALVPVIPGAASLGIKSLRAGDKGGDARFIVDRKGNTVDLNSTPQGSYQQPNGGRTDILQRDDHGAGLSHTHDPKLNTNPQTGETFINGLEKPGRSVSFEDVQNINSGKTVPPPPKNR